MSEHDEIIAETREKYTVHNCGQCDFRKSCDLGANGFDTDECREMRQSIMLGFGIEDGYFTKLLNRLEAAHKRDIENAIAATVKAAAKSASEVYEPHIQSDPSGNAAKMREALVQCELFLGNVSRHGHPTLNPGDKCTACDGADELRGMVARALAEPLRNCDVGTAEEQGDRFILFCRRNSFRGVCNDSCKFANVNRRLGWQKIGQARCFPFWAQMPYESGVK